MFDCSSPNVVELAALDNAALVDLVRAFARAENAACARKQAVMAELFCRRTKCASAQERHDWWIDPEWSVGAELGAAQGISQGLALGQAHRGVALRERLPKVAELFAAGEITDLLVRTIVYRTHLIENPEALAAVDALLADQVKRWGPLSQKKTEHAIDALIDQVDPGALRQTRRLDRQRWLEFGTPDDEAGFESIYGRLYASDSALVERRVKELARTVCDDDPRTLKERLADSLAAMAVGADRLPCGCGDENCPAGPSDAPERNIVLHLVADSTAVAAAATPPAAPAPEPDPTPPNDPPPEPDPATPKDRPPSTAPAGASAPRSLLPESSLVIDGNGALVRPACAPPAYVMGGGLMPAPLLAGLMDRAVVREVVHPGAAPPEPRYTPSRKLADFVRCRDLTCRWPGCDKPADLCDLDHTVPYPYGPTHASNLKCLCRFHHLMKTFWVGNPGWRDRQLPDGTVIWTSPTGHTYTTYPGALWHFPMLCTPTGTLELPDTMPPAGHGRGVMMPKRRRTRAEDRARRIAEERGLNDDHVAKRNRPPPF
ncbi:HNH endonuclease signature motif containing protein [Mycobacterium hubeiense]|uniref:HNH endonuclease signature motif containing protein n=1 Tax=Mycobacterium hubeiense TaxID=1867256 RepID=UPI000C7EA6F7|nr:HNH endonuclease signature motif containing protein [Mycobacterium sp. QGD 101]